MVKLLFVLMNEYRLWALPQALAALERRYPGAVEGRVYSVREINADAGLERALLADGAAADMAFLASHGSDVYKRQGGVGVQGKPRREVPQHSGYRFHVHPVLEGQGGKCVTQIVEPHSR